MTDQTNAMNSLVQEFMKEIRADKRKALIFRAVGWIYLLGSTLLFAILFFSDGGKAKDEESPHLAVIDVLAPIQRKGGVAADNVIQALQKAFKQENTQAILLDMDSPGGSAAQSDLIYREILRLREEYPDKPVYAVVGDLCASGCYFIASAANEIIVNSTSMIGNIGVRMDSFGFTGLMERLGVERRIITAGENKILSDPFSTIKPEIQEHLRDHVLATTHQVFIDAVKNGRGERLNDNPEIFSGLVWVGQEAVEIGLADKIGSIGSISRELMEEPKVVNYSVRNTRLLDLFTGTATELKQTFVGGDVRLSW